ncbi:MAG: hypothetical protein H7836_04490 [Magnetococcus sp. YQC-3]
MNRYVKNASLIQKVYSGITIDPGTFYLIPANLVNEFATDSVLMSDIASGVAFISKDGNTVINDIGQQINFLVSGFQQPTDASHRPIYRIATTTEGWHYQAHCLEFTTSKINGYYNKNENGVDLGFVNHKIYKLIEGSYVQITDALEENLAVKTEINWNATHPFDIVGGKYIHNLPPSSDCYFYLLGLPGIANVHFFNGGLNLKNIASGQPVDFDGRSSKYLPSGIPHFRIIINHALGVVHTGQMIFELFEP